MAPEEESDTRHQLLRLEEQRPLVLLASESESVGNLNDSSVLGSLASACQNATVTATGGACRRPVGAGLQRRACHRADSGPRRARPGLQGAPPRAPSWWTLSDPSPRPSPEPAVSANLALEVSSPAPSLPAAEEPGQWLPASASVASWPELEMRAPGAHKC